ncbi:hypothetical protein JNK13_01670 [bacterium]|nr:hypothetical protein [bacterium]
MKLKKSSHCFFSTYLVCFFASSLLAQDQEVISKPKIHLNSRSGNTTATSDNAAVGASIVIEAIESDYDLGARLEIKPKDVEHYDVVASYAPDGVGDEVNNGIWTYTANYFEVGKEYDIRAKLFSRSGIESEYAEASLKMEPAGILPCSENEIVDIEFENLGSEKNPVTALSWRPVCARGSWGLLSATSYQIYKNGVLMPEIEPGNTAYVFEGTLEGDSFEIKAYGEEPPNTNPGAITTCPQIKPAFATRGANVEVIRCERVGNWLRSIVKFAPWASGSGVTHPTGWLSMSYNANPPWYNYPLGFIAHPTNQSWQIANAYALCASNENTNTDPWQAVSWNCPDPEINSAVYPITQSNYYWVNFDLTSSTSGGNSAWPITKTVSR